MPTMWNQLRQEQEHDGAAAGSGDREAESENTAEQASAHNDDKNILKKLVWQTWRKAALRTKPLKQT